MKDNSASHRKSALLWLSAGAVCLLASQASRAEEQPSPPAQDSLMLPSGAIPTQIFGNECVKQEGDTNFAPSLRCMAAGPIGKKPSIGVSVQNSTCEKTQEQMIAERRAQVNDGTPFFNVIWEEGFSPPSVPQSVGFRAFYQTMQGNRYFWATCGQGKLTRVLVIMFAPTDNEALKAEIEEKVFSFIRSASVAAKDLNP